jgi:serine acetyltransferase
MGGIKVGRNSFIGALSLVNKDVPENAIVASIPARILRIQNEQELHEHPCWDYIKDNHC